MRSTLATVAGALVAGAVARGASAAPSPAPDAQAATPWTLGMVGGIEQPMGASSDQHERGLDAGMRLAWTSRFGLGVEAALDYSPMPHAPSPDGARFDTTFASAAIGPRFAAGWSRFGIAVEAGGGVAVDHTNEQSPLLLGGVTRTTDVAPALEAGVEIELTVVSGGGIMLTGGGTRAFGGVATEYAWGMGGLALSF